MNELVRFNAFVGGPDVRNDTHLGKDFLVVPVVALMEGVFQGTLAEEPEYVPAAALEKGVPSWNGRPVTLNHPEVNGELVSANNPDVLEDWQFGLTFNTQMKDGKLTTEAWLDKSRAESLDGEFLEAFEALENKETLEVSTGAFVIKQEGDGVFGGRSYSGSWDSVFPDHLAILSKGKIGACSVADGCGTMRTQDASPSLDTSSGAFYALVAEEDDDTIYTDMKAHAEGKHGGKFRSMVDKFLGQLGLKTNFSHSNIRTALEAALEKVHEVDWVYVTAVFDDSVVYERSDEYYKLWQRSYSINDAGEIALGSEITEVTPKLDYVPLKVTIEEKSIMEKKDKIAALIKSGAFTECEQSMLEGLEEKVIDQMVGAQAVKAVADTTTEAKTDADTIADLTTKLKASEDALAKATAAPAATDTNTDTDTDGEDEVAPEVLEEALALRTQQRTNIVTHLLKDKQCDFTQEDLEAMSTKQLQSLNKMTTRPVVISGGDSTLSAQEGDNDVPAAPKVFGAAGGDS